MSHIIARRPSLGTVFGLLALFVAVGGVATAQTPTTPTPPPGVTGVPPVPEAQHAVHADYADAAPVSRIKYLSEREKVREDNDCCGAEAVKIQVRCPEGMNVVGGGVNTSGGEPRNDFETVVSGPVGNDSWLVKVNPSEDEIGDEVRVTAICVNAAETDSNYDRSG